LRSLRRQHRDLTTPLSEVHCREKAAPRDPGRLSDLGDSGRLGQPIPQRLDHNFVALDGDAIERAAAFGHQKGTSTPNVERLSKPPELVQASAVEAPGLMRTMPPEARLLT
jgi:hypothetical protein